MPKRLALRQRARAAGLHLLISTLLAAAAGALVFGLWYPGIYRLASGGRDLFLLVTGVDVVLGPLLTFAVFDLAKGWKHLRRDLAVIGAIQTAALIYGLHTVYIVRPVALVFEVDRFRVVTAADIYRPELPQARPEYRQLPLAGPWLLAARAAEPGEERSQAIFMALDGVDIGQRPTFWQPYGDSVADVLARSRPVFVLVARYPERAAEINAKLDEVGLDVKDARFLPVAARGDWVAILNQAGGVAGFVAMDGFF